jgi:2-phospho-L-lactate guanylyltransferase
MNGISMVVLAKDTKRAKTRLGMDRGRAQALAVLLAGRTVLKATESSCIGTVFVVTSDPIISADAVRLGATVVPERRAVGMNRAADLGRRRALARRPDEPVAVVVADLPALQPIDLDLVIQEHHENGTPLYVPDHHGVGTTMLIHGPSERPGVAFGLHSADMHRRLGYVAASCARWGLRQDLDTPDDLSRLAPDDWTGHTVLADPRELSGSTAPR